MRELIRLVSSAGTGHFYTTDKNKRTKPEKIEIKRYDPGCSSARDLQGSQDQVIDPAPCRKAAPGGLFIPAYEPRAAHKKSPPGGGQSNKHSG